MPTRPHSGHLKILTPIDEVIGSEAPATAPVTPPAPSGTRSPSALLHPDAVAERLQVSRRTLRRLHRAGDLLAIKVGGSVRYREEEIERYLASLSSKP